ncbi:MAG: CDP-alcohol phosphatidyltransferase family protein [Gaiellales bacterium]|nr:MAG: CDP-alcohol phosphatidyltransferase family protein [Gaiellales bacterium]
MSKSDKGRVATPANLLSLSRIVAVPYIFYLLLSSDDGSSTAATIVFVAAACTDFLDGLFARSTGSVSDLGRKLDPAADRILISSTIIALMISGSLPIIGVALVVARDIFMILGYKLVERRGVTMRVSYLGKTYTALFMVALVLVMAGIEPGGRAVGLWLFWACVAGSILSGISYTARSLVIIRAREASSGGT